MGVENNMGRWITLNSQNCVTKIRKKDIVKIVSYEDKKEIYLRNGMITTINYEKGSK